MTQNLSHPKYRPDIDGLRAIAVLSVVFYHAFSITLHGGFVGVDIFFVISGFLISTIIFKNIETGSFSFTEFYVRRIRRIFPSFILVLMASYVLGWHFLLPDEFKQLGKHIASSAAFIQNITLWKEAGYFDNLSKTKPLLHIWSLGIEEQFYFFWPFLIWASYKKKLNLRWVTIAIMATSFILGEWQIRSEPIRVFYSPQTRFWELLVGACLALPGCQKINVLTIKMEKFRHIISVLGTSLLLFALFRFNENTMFPGFRALLPVLGAVSIIWAGPKAFVNQKVLSNRILVWFGLISYPLYLWHWPLLSFSRIAENDEPSRVYRISIVILSILLAWVTTRFIEKPLRFGGREKLKSVFLVSLMIFIGLIGFETYIRNGLIERFSLFSPETKERIEKIAEAWKQLDYPDPQGVIRDKQISLLTLSSDTPEKILLIGDSHAEQYKYAFNDLFKSQPELKKKWPSIWIQLGAGYDKLNPKYLHDQSIKTVVFSFYWLFRYDADENPDLRPEFLQCNIGKEEVIKKICAFYTTEKLDQVDARIRLNIQELNKAGKKVVLILDNPIGKEHEPRSIIQRDWRGIRLRSLTPLNRDEAIRRTEPVRSRLLKIAKETHAEVIDPFDFLCDANFCSTFDPEGNLLYKDCDHLSIFGSSQQGQKIMNALFKLTEDVQSKTHN